MFFWFHFAPKDTYFITKHICFRKKLSTFIFCPFKKTHTIFRICQLIANFAPEQSQKKKTLMNFITEIRQSWHRFMNNDDLKLKIYSVVFESDTPKGKLFDIILIGSILLSVILVILESMHIFPHSAYLELRILEYLLTLFFTAEYLARIYCLKHPKKYIFSFFGIVDLLATLPVYLSFFLHGSHYLLVIRAFRLIRVFRVFKLFLFINEGNLLLRSLWMSAPKISIFFFFILILVTSMGTVMYMIEGDHPGSGFNNIPNSIYWAIVTMTTVGYGDITPVTPVGRFISAVIMLIGYTIIAVPTGIVSATMVSQHKQREKRKCPRCHRDGHDFEAHYCKYCGTRLKEEKHPEHPNERPNDARF